MNLDLAAAERLEKAAAIVQRGWAQNRYHHREATIFDGYFVVIETACAAGALFHAQLGYAIDRSYSPDPATVHAVQALARAIDDNRAPWLAPVFIFTKEYGDCLATITKWNDTYGQTQKQVVAMLLAVATTLRARAQPVPTVTPIAKTAEEVPV